MFELSEYVEGERDNYNSDLFYLFLLQNWIDLNIFSRIIIKGFGYAVCFLNIFILVKLFNGRLKRAVKLVNLSD